MSSDIRESLAALEKLVNHIKRETHVENEAPSFDVEIGIEGDGKPHGYTVAVDDETARQNVLVINGDVTFNDGQINHFGDILIKGNVEPGSVIRASRNIEIAGEIVNASVNAGGNITVLTGIQGGEEGNIVANGNLVAGFIENATVSVAGSVKADYILDSDVSSEGYIIVNGKESYISGGKVHGLLGIDAREIGNELEEPTVIMAGYSSENYSRYLDMADKEADLSEKLSDTVNEITKIVKKIREKSMDVSKARDILDKLNDEKDFCFHELDNIRFDITQVEGKLKKGKGSAVSVSETVYPGTILEIEGVAFRIPAKTSYIKYLCEGNQIISKVYGQ